MKVGMHNYGTWLLRVNGKNETENDVEYFGEISQCQHVD